MQEDEDCQLFRVQEAMDVASKKDEPSLNQRLRVLVVDDELISRKTTTQQLREAGYEAESAADAVLALECLGQGGWDVVVTDLCMPAMDGLTLLKRIKQGYPEVDVFLMTAYGSIEAAVEAKKVGATDFLIKPFSFQELDLRLKKLANLRATGSR